MENLAILLRVLQLYTHNAHNLADKVVFFQDHEYLGELYPEYETSYDDVIERIIGLGNSEIDLVQIDSDAVSVLKSMPKKEATNSMYFQRIYELEKQLRSHIDSIYPESSIGTQQLIGDMADKSEKRSYKLGQRIKK